MSTEFVSKTTGELGFVRWSGNSGRGVCYEFGTCTNWDSVGRWMDQGDRFFPLGMEMDSDPTTSEDLRQLVLCHRATFGEFPVTVELGSGDLTRFTVEE